MITCSFSTHGTATEYYPAECLLRNHPIHPQFLPAMNPLAVDHFNFSLPPEYAPYVNLLFGILMLYFGITALRKAKRLSKKGIKTQGVLVRIVPGRSFSISIGSGSSHSHRENDTMDGFYRYTDEQGHEYEIKSSAYDCSVIGSTTTTVLYNPENPSDAIVTDSGIPQLVPIIVTLGGIGFAAYGIFQLPL